MIHDRAFYDALETPRKVFVPFCEYTQYRSILRRCHVALLPLEDTPFNRCKSDLKFLECAIETTVCIAGTTVYGKTCEEDSRSPFFIGMPNDSRNASLAMALKRANEGDEELDGSGAVTATMIDSFRYVRDNRLLSQHYRKRYDWYCDLIRHKQHLTQQLMERVPELSLEPA